MGPIRFVVRMVSERGLREQADGPQAGWTDLSFTGSALPVHLLQFRKLEAA